LRRNIFILGLIAVVAAFATTAFAANVHFKNNGGPNPAVTGSSFETLTVSGTLVGLGKSPGTIELQAFGTATTTCQNPGTNQKTVESQGSDGPIADAIVDINPDQITRSGNYTFTVSATAEGGSCPNDNWTKTTTVDFTSYQLIVTQGDTVTVLGPFAV